MENSKLQIVAVNVEGDQETIGEVRPPVSLCPKCSRLYSFEMFLAHPCIRPARTPRRETDGKMTRTREVR